MAKAKILVVEDEAIIAMGIETTLKNQGYEVLYTVSSGEEAIRKVSKICPDLVLMDIELNGRMNGIEATRQIQKLVDIPVVYLTAKTNVTTLQEAKITEPYRYIVKPFDGRSLGIAIEMALCKHKGDGSKIEAESEVGKDSKFTLQFPVATNFDRPKESPETNQEIKTNSLRILVVDDEEAICDILEKFLSSNGNKVKAVNNGKEAIKLIKSEEFDLVLCDIGMPDVFGYDVIKALNELEKRPKIFINTGGGENLKTPDVEGFKVDLIVGKPFALPKLAGHINNMFVR